MLGLELGVKTEINLKVKLTVKLEAKFCIGIPKMYGRIRNGLSKNTWMDLYWSPQSAVTVPYWPTSGFPSNLLPHDFQSRGIPEYHSYYARKAPK